jgi:glycolate oxidase FAD binding subunit
VTQKPTTVTDLAAAIRDAAERHHALRLVTRGTWLRGGAPVDERAEPLHLDAFGGVIEYEPGDLTITVGAAMTIAELDAITAAHNQWCPLAPWGGDAGSVGATVATATAGPYSRALGLPRDLVLGLECVDGTGKVLRPGGKVVKNVAGFDLTRLMTGSWGSLAAITRVSLRLRAKPKVDETWVVMLDGRDVKATIAELGRCPAPPVACETLPSRGTNALLARLIGNPGFVTAARGQLQRVGRCDAEPSSSWSALRESRTTRAPAAAMSDGVRALNTRIKQTFDPANILNPGIMG